VGAEHREQDHRQHRQRRLHREHQDEILARALAEPVEHHEVGSDGEHDHHHRREEDPHA
jgi:hypothetical protein